MDIAELIEIALANSDERRVEIAALEPADIVMEAVSGLAQLVSELVDNATAFSEPEDRVRVTGLHERGDYLISISDRGVGIPEHLLDGLNRVLENPDQAAGGADPKLGIALVARLAARHGIDVRLVPGAPGTTARVMVPARLVGETAQTEPGPESSQEYRLPPRVRDREPDEVFAKADEVEESIDLTRFERDHGVGSGIVAMSEEARAEAEAFLEKVFAPLMSRRGASERPAPRPSANGRDSARPGERPVEPDRAQASETGGTVTALRVRVPGENFSLVADEPSTVAAEGAIDIRSALSRYQQGRRSAASAEGEGA